MTKKERGKNKKSSCAPRLQWHFAPDVPVNDFFQYIDLDAPFDVDRAVFLLIDRLESGYYLLWEAVVYQEQSIPLSSEH